ncbi:hypothetical protein TSUD_247470 [Trifolium subterraneum]|uniref:Uncharacterized protein n=1 Tax=Trifolium subterraneum TaxID=3900 RepID=A0A2Z6PDA7_TRISU|nr:hypothetical protein TSUD_247470 [Trifolium subterraneum]
MYDGFQIPSLKRVTDLKFPHYNVAGPSGSAGGGIFGAATDGKRIYTNIANSDRRNFELLPSNMNTTAGGWVSMNANNGRILWSTANPGNSAAIGPVSVANDVVFVGSTDRLGHIYAINAINGHGYNVSLGASSGFTSGNSLFAFCVL